MPRGHTRHWPLRPHITKERPPFLRLLVNTLSIGSMSGNHVVYGFLRPLLQWMQPDHEIIVLHYEGQAPPADVAAHVASYPVSAKYRHWARRTLWEAMRLPAVVRELRADVMLNVSGALSANCDIPQVVLCQNPWCFRPSAHRHWKDRLKARMQRAGYRRAFKGADLMIYLSDHLRGLYRAANPDAREQDSEIAFVGLNEDTYMSARDLAGTEREPFSILSVSAMANWKGADTLVEAVHLLRQRDIPATLKLVGPWPDQNYENKVRELITQFNLTDSVQIRGKVSDEELHRLYATHQVYCLMSSCESFGIPAAEAMCFGTPVISTDCCAISEICQPAGLFGPVSDPEWTADALDTALTDNLQWETWSRNAVDRAEQLRWENCAQAFRRIPELVGQSLPPLSTDEQPAFAEVP